MGGLAVSGDLCAAEGQGQSDVRHDDAMAGPAHHAGWTDSYSDSSGSRRAGMMRPDHQALAELGLVEDQSSGQTEDQGDFRPPPGLEPVRA